MRSFTTIGFVLIMAASSSVMAKNLSSYQDVLGAMKTGKTVFALVDYSKCSMKQKSSGGNIETRSVGIRMDHLYELTETRSDGKRMNVVGYAQHNWGGGQSYMLSRLLIHVWEDNSVEVIDDSVDPTTYKLKDREWIQCQATGDGSGGVTFNVI